MMNHVDLPIILYAFCELTDESVITDDDSIAVLLERTRPRLEIIVFHKLAEALKNMEAYCDFYKSLLHTLKNEISLFKQISS